MGHFGRGDQLNSDVIFAKNNSWTPMKSLAMEPVGTVSQNGAFSRSNEPRSSCGANVSPQPKRPIFKNFDDIFAKNISWRSVWTLVIDPVSPDGQNSPFSRSNEPRSRIPTHFFKKNSWTSVETIVVELVGPDSQNSPFSRSNEPRRW
ncbi:hypothetical protein H5410_031940 [Solanum commersonii]|uniref:Uncharacterized protein n=1 Tax=Solanum commersonii TaxID=4109 RepID=A0A9J5YJN3_SOLCO|nr:hypothetical protein H5410_031940 [Solanum commersonii]